MFSPHSLAGQSAKPLWYLLAKLPKSRVFAQQCNKLDNGLPVLAL